MTRGRSSTVPAVLLATAAVFIVARAGAADVVDPLLVRVEAKRRTTDSAWQWMETRSLASVEDIGELRAPPQNRWGGRADRVIAPPGRFRVLRDGRRWIFADPDGCEWFSIGICSVSTGRSPRSQEALRQRFGSIERWAEEVTDLLWRHGFNTLACWSDWSRLRQVRRPMPYTTQLNLMGSFGRRYHGAWQVSGHLAYSNNCIPVFDPRFAEFARMLAAEILAPIRDDPLCVGHFSDNELPFPEDALERHLALPAGTAGREEAVRWLRARRPNSPAEQPTTADRAAFLEHLAETYFRLCAEAIRAAAPRHLYLGARFHGADLRRPELFRAAGRHVDVISVNWYGVWTPEAARIAEWATAAQRPVMITEWYAKGMDSGLDNVSGAGWTVKTQRDRGLFYQNFTLALLRSPDCVGWHWFKYMDNDPADTRADPSNRDSNKGIVSATYQPWTELLVRMRALNELAYPLRDRLAPR
ncbi:MAG: hypothetical protein N2652_10435 [Kiritimatiellae bacterium]|nr:hypothetical protein [Kiritimatiellia bacterium]